MTMSYQKKAILFGILFSCHSSAFQHPSVPSTRSFPRWTSHLHGISEWRDSFFEYPSSVDDVIDKEIQEGPVREVCVLPFPIQDILLQGETKELCLYEDRFHQLFKRATENHNNVVAMGLMAPPSGILQTMTLCEIENFQKMPGQTEFGTSHSILVTIRAVGRASLLQLQEEDVTAEYMYGYCTEFCDDTCSERKGVTDRENDVILEGNKLSDELEAKMESIVELESQLEEFEDDDDEPDRRDRLDEAFKIAKINDWQGYRISSSASTSSTTSRSVQDLTAFSWAYFSTEDNPIDILSYRVQALGCTDLSERLRLASTMLSEKSSTLKKTLNGSKSNDQDDEES